MNMYNDAKFDRHTAHSEMNLTNEKGTFHNSYTTYNQNLTHSIFSRCVYKIFRKSEKAAISAIVLPY